MTDETTNLFANLRTAIEVAGLGGAFAVVEVDDLEAVIALAETGAALASCEQIAREHDLCVLTDWTHYSDTETAAYMVEIWYDDARQMCRYEEKYEGTGNDNAEALARLALAALESEAVSA